jgi:putative ATP-dependent endonuclease of OLD family
MIKIIRIKNFRSIEDLELELGKDTLLIGQSGTGKSNFLSAVNLSLGADMDVSEYDIFIKDGERFSTSKRATIDIMIIPVDQNMNRIQNFSNYWMVILAGLTRKTHLNYMYCNIRAEVLYNTTINKYCVVHRVVNDWGDSIDSSTAGHLFTFSEAMKNSLLSFYADTNRDVVTELKNKTSFLNEMVANFDAPEDKITEIEKTLNKANDLIATNSPSVKNISSDISKFCKDVGLRSVGKIEAIPSKLSDIYRSIDLLLQDGGAKLSVYLNGPGTSSVLWFIVLLIYTNFREESSKIIDEKAEQYVALLIEEIEIHLHPQMQRQLHRFISENFKGQIITTTHSVSIITQANFSNCVFFTMKNGRTIIGSYPNADVSIDDIKHIISLGHCDMFFASAIILAEGQTEQLALPIFFNKQFKEPPECLGVSIIGMGGLKYKVYLSLIKDLNIPWLIFSDGDDNATNAIKKAIRIFDYNNTDRPNIIILENKNDFERQLIDEGYAETMISSLNRYENPEYFDNFLLEFYSRESQTNEQNSTRSYSPEEREIALKALCRSHKAEHAIIFANAIVALESKPVPLCINKLFDAVKNITEES